MVRRRRGAAVVRASGGGGPGAPAAERAIAAAAALAAERPALRQRALKALGTNRAVYVEGGSQQTRNGVEGHARFRQEPNFLYLTGVELPDYAAVLFTAAEAGGAPELVLLAPRLPAGMEIWVGAQPTLEELREQYGATAVVYAEELPRVILERDARPDTVFTLKGVDVPEAWPQPPPVDKEALGRVLAQARAVKHPAEVACLEVANAGSGAAHQALWRAAARAGSGGPDLYEFQLEAIFAQETMLRGLRELGYPAIVGAGRNAATLHYETNSAVVRAGQLVLVDAGAECSGYTADITRTFPAGGKFTEQQRKLYDAVLHVQQVGIDLIRPGADWQVDVARPAQVATAQKLVELGVVVADADPEELVDEGVVRLFYPHGLGHMLGLQVHDVGETGPLPTTLKPGMVVTCEPGIYFIDALLNPALEDPSKAKYLNVDELAKWRDIGGVRIEDNILVTEDGCRNLTTVPKAADEVESLCMG